MYFMALSFFVLVFWSLRRLLNAPLGHVFVGIRENEPRMNAIGYPTRVYKLASFTIAGAIAGFALTVSQQIRSSPCSVVLRQIVRP